MATGRMFPEPGRYGLSSAQIASKVTTTIVVAEPISIACERFSSAESAKKHEDEDDRGAQQRTTQTVVGVIPAAPWMRSCRACSRSDVWSSHFANAASCSGVDVLAE